MGQTKWEHHYWRTWWLMNKWWTRSLGPKQGHEKEVCRVLSYFLQNFRDKTEGGGGGKGLPEEVRPSNGIIIYHPSLGVRRSCAIVQKTMIEGRHKKNNLGSFQRQKNLVEDRLVEGRKFSLERKSVIKFWWPGMWDAERVIPFWGHQVRRRRVQRQRRTKRVPPWWTTPPWNCPKEWEAIGRSPDSRNPGELRTQPWAPTCWCGEETKNLKAMRVQ